MIGGQPHAQWPAQRWTDGTDWQVPAAAAPVEAVAADTSLIEMTAAKEDARLPIDFATGGNFAQFRSSGFSQQEELGTWSMGPESMISVPLPEARDRLVLRLSVCPCLVPGQNSDQSLEIVIGESCVYRARLREWTTIEVGLPGALLGGDRTVEIRFRHPDAVTPLLGHEVADTRLLAFMFQRLDVAVGDVPVEVSAATPLPPQGGPPRPVGEAKQAEVVSGPDGWLFLVGGSNNALRYYTDPAYFDEAKADAWVAVLGARFQRLSALGVRYLHIAAPDKISVYPEYVPVPLPNFAWHPIRLLSARMPAGLRERVLIDPLPAFRAAPDFKLLYLRTDTHWTYRAGQIVLRLVTERLGLPRRPDLEGRVISHYTTTLDLGAKVEPRIAEPYYAVETLPSVSRVYANAPTTLFEQAVRARKPVVHGSINVVFRNTDPAAIDAKVVIFGDSFMDFQDSNTTVIFAENFREVHFVWSPNIDYSYIEKHRPSLVITETTERFMITVPTDEYDLEAAVAQAIKHYEG